MILLLLSFSLFIVYSIVCDFQFVVHSNLGKVVKEVVDEFRHNPPVPLPSSTNATYVCFFSCSSSAVIYLTIYQQSDSDDDRMIKC